MDFLCIIIVVEVVLKSLSTFAQQHQLWSEYYNHHHSIIIASSSLLCNHPNVPPVIYCIIINCCQHRHWGSHFLFHKQRYCLCCQTHYIILFHFYSIQFYSQVKKKCDHKNNEKRHWLNMVIEKLCFAVCCYKFSHIYTCISKLIVSTTQAVASLLDVLITRHALWTMWLFY
jgi:hypothetical protein